MTKNVVTPSDTEDKQRIARLREEHTFYRTEDGLVTVRAEDIAALFRAFAEANVKIADAWDEGYMAVPAEPEDREVFVEDAPNPHRADPDGDGDSGLKREGDENEHHRRRA